MIMKLRDNYITHEFEDETLLIATGDAPFGDLVHGNRTFGAILQLLRNEATEQDIITAMCDRFDAPAEIIARDVHRVITQLREIGALDE